MKLKLFVLTILLSNAIIAQIPTKLGFTLSGKYSEDIAITKAQKFLLKEIFDHPEGIIQIELDRIASTISGDLNLFFYSYKDKKGLLLAFYGDYWNDAGDVYKGFVFKNLSENKTLELLNQIDRILSEQKEYLSKAANSHAIFSSMTFLS